MEMIPVRTWAFRINAVPKPQPRQRSAAYLDKAGRARSSRPYTPAKHPVNVFKAAVADAATVQFEGQPYITGPVHVGLTVVLPRPRSLTREWKSTGRVPLIKVKGDNENFEKAVYDAMEGIVYDNDARIYSNFTESWYAAEGESPHTLVYIEERAYQPALEERPPDGRKRKRDQSPPQGQAEAAETIL